MARNSVAVLDVRSSALTFVVGERGVNNTFALRAMKSVDCTTYGAYENGYFCDEESLKKSLSYLLGEAEQTSGIKIKEVYVGVPGAFCEVFPREKQIGFPKRRKITAKEVNELQRSGREERVGARCIYETGMIYTTADDRRIAEPAKAGLVTSTLKGEISYFYAKNYFVEIFDKFFGGRKIIAHFLPQEYATAAYLISPDRRDECALFLDTGLTSSTVCAIYGNGFLEQRAIEGGLFEIAAAVAEEFSLELDDAFALLSKASLGPKAGVGVTQYPLGVDRACTIDASAYANFVKKQLNDFCEKLGSFLERYNTRDFFLKPIYVTGDGIVDIRGALEYIGDRHERVCERVAPLIPSYNKPSMSSRIALLDMACTEHSKNTFFSRLLGGLGG